MAATPGKVALLASDYVGLRPTVRVAVGDDIRRGQLLFEDKKTPGVRYTSPGAGKVAAIHRGERRALQSIVIELSQDERGGRAGGPEEASFSSFTGKHPGGLSRDDVAGLLIESGTWTALRGRPFSRVANPNDKPRAVFVTAMDTNPLAPSVDVALEGRHSDFEHGLVALSKLTEGPVFVCTSPGSKVPIPGDDQFRHEEFQGPHPAGMVGLHIHQLDPVDGNKVVWHVGLSGCGGDWKALSDRQARCGARDLHRRSGGTPVLGWCVQEWARRRMISSRASYRKEITVSSQALSFRDARFPGRPWVISDGTIGR